MCSVEVNGIIDVMDVDVDVDADVVDVDVNVDIVDVGGYGGCWNLVR